MNLIAIVLFSRNEQHHFHYQHFLMISIIITLGLEHLSYEEKLRKLRQPGEGSRGSHQCAQLLEGRMQRRQSQALSSASQWQDKRQWAQTETQGVSSKHQEALLYCAGNGALAQIAQRGCGGSSLEIFKSRLDVGRDNLLEQGLGQMDPEVPFSLNPSVILCLLSLLLADK